MPALRRVGSPAAVRALSQSELVDAAADIRSFLVEKVSRVGGHLGPNLGVVELTLALHRVFDSPSDPIIFDVGHQAYVHKIITGRADDFDTLRSHKGLSGYPSRAESEHDWVENSHASTSLAYADGLAKAFALRGESYRTVVAVIGDGALTGGMAWEALNNIAAAHDRPVIIVLNDNGRSYAPTAGGMAERLAAFRLRPGYERLLGRVKSTLPRTPVVGRPLYGVLHAAKSALKDWLLPQTLFSDLGLKYLGPIDGHDVAGVERALRRAKNFRGPVLVHCLTRKGQGYPPAEHDDAELMHSPPAFDPATGTPLPRAGTSWTEVFGRELVLAGTSRPDLVAVTAAMRGPTGLDPFAAAFPDRVFDVGIAEQHALTSAAGLAMGGMRPVVAVYASFLNRAFDQLLMDCALHHLPVTLVLDRAGVTGPDGPSHHGMWDLALAGLVPGLRLAAPRDAPSLAEELTEALAVDDGPTVLRWPKGMVPPPVPALRRFGTVDVLAEPDHKTERHCDGGAHPDAASHRYGGPHPDAASHRNGGAHPDAGSHRNDGAHPDAASHRDGGAHPEAGSHRNGEHRAGRDGGGIGDVLLVAVGAFATTAVRVASRLADQGIRVTVVDPRWALPVPDEIAVLAAEHRLVVTLEDGGRSGGVGSAIADRLAGIGIPVTVLALPQEFLEAGSRDELLDALGLSAQSVARRITELVAALDDPDLIAAHHHQQARHG